MAHYIFLQGVRPGSWELLEKIEHSDLAREVYRNYQLRLSQGSHGTVAMVEAPNLLEEQTRLRTRQDTPEAVAPLHPCGVGIPALAPKRGRSLLPFLSPKKPPQ